MFVIIDISENAESWLFTGEHIPEKRRPKYIHLSHYSAVEELLRLQRACPTGSFVMFEAIMRAYPTMEDRSVYIAEECARTPK